MACQAANVRTQLVSVRQMVGRRRIPAGRVLHRQQKVRSEELEAQRDRGVYLLDLDGARFSHASREGGRRTHIIFSTADSEEGQRNLFEKLERL